MATYRPPQDVRLYRLEALQDSVRSGWQQLYHTNILDSDPPRLLHWDSKLEALQIWAWPCYPDGRRVPPDELQEYFCEYHARPPCCLCAYVDSGRYYVSAKISLVETVNRDVEDTNRRPFVGEYVAECASNSCGYFVIIERFFSSKVLLQSAHKKRAYRFDMSLYDQFIGDNDDDWESEFIPGIKKSPRGFRRVCVDSTPQKATNFSRGPNRLKRLREECDEEAQQAADELTILVKSGLPASDFWAQFVQCAACDYVIPRHLYPYAHRCSKRIRRPHDETPSSPLITPTAGVHAGSATSNSDHEDILERLTRGADEEDTDDELSVTEEDTDDELTLDAVVRYLQGANSTRK
ncbi:hypothetical protein FA13DRAFT_1802484 [Coprinellus micaceus]|nr:hypothetical protein FA13DRAFT_1802484 [Coprinellus micaceus]